VHGVARHDEHAALPGEALDERDAAGHGEAPGGSVSSRQVGPRVLLREGQQPAQRLLLQPVGKSRASDGLTQAPNRNKQEVLGGSNLSTSPT
jgi:hypothetical protein